MRSTSITRRRSLRSGLGVTVLAVSLGLAPLAQAQATPEDGPETESIQEALQRDLGLTPAEATETLEQEADASATAEKLDASLGGEFAGAFIAPGTEELTVAVTEPAAAEAVREAGATPVVVARSQDELVDVQAEVDGAAGNTRAITSTHVDPETNTVVVTVTPGSTGAAEASVAAAGVDGAAVRVVESAAVPRTLAAYRGGDAYFIDGRGRCSVGFAVTGRTSGNDGFVTAGHCGEIGSSVSAGRSGATGGTFVGSSFPGDDYAVVRTNRNFTGTGIVTGARGAAVAVRGSTPAVVGAAVCRSGSTTGWQCGRVQAIGSSVNYREGRVFGVTRTSACAEPGDSGGSWISGNQAQGVTSGGSGDCNVGGTTYFQPVNEILDRYDATLVTN